MKPLMFRIRSFVLFTICVFLFSVSSAQVSSAIDSTSIEIGAQITYSIQVETDTTQLVVFPEGQSFSPLEMIESYKIDTLKKADTYNLVKKYGLTQFDSGAYTIPRQKVIVGDKTFFTDSLKVEVNNVVVDTTKQGLYDIKPIIEVEKTAGNWWKYVLIVLLITACAATLIYWFVWRKKPLTEAEQIALLPPYDRAKLSLQKLDESHYLEHSELKTYYSELTLIIRKYLDEKVYDHSLESTTEELINRLRLLKDGNQIDLSSETIKNLESILKRADLVKFAKSAPDVALAELDRNTIDAEIDHVKAVLPEPSEEEKLLDEKYRAELARKKKQKKIFITLGIGLGLIFLSYIGFSLKYGFAYVKDTIVGNETKELLEGEWVTSAYGFPPVTIETPAVLKRVEAQLPDELKSRMTVSVFEFRENRSFHIGLTSTSMKQAQDSLDINQVIEASLKKLESEGARNILTKDEKFITPHGAEGIKIFGTLDYPVENTEQFIKGEYVSLMFTDNKSVVQQIFLSYKEDDVYADQITERILNSVELKEAEK